MTIKPITAHLKPSNSICLSTNTVGIDISTEDAYDLISTLTRLLVEQQARKTQYEAESAARAARKETAEIYGTNAASRGDSRERLSDSMTVLLAIADRSEGNALVTAFNTAYDARTKEIFG